MKTNTLLGISVAVLAGIVIYLLLNMQTKTTVSREYIPVVYEERPRDTILVGRWGGWGGWGIPTKPWGGHPPPPPPPPPGGGAPPPPPPGDAPPPPASPSEPPAEPPATFLDMSKNIEGFFSPASYPFA